MKDVILTTKENFAIHPRTFSEDERRHCR